MSCADILLYSTFHHGVCALNWGEFNGCSNSGLLLPKGSPGLRLSKSCWTCHGVGTKTTKTLIRLACRGTKHTSCSTGSSTKTSCRGCTKTSGYGSCRFKSWGRTSEWGGRTKTSSKSCRGCGLRCTKKTTSCGLGWLSWTWKSRIF